MVEVHREPAKLNFPGPKQSFSIEFKIVSDWYGSDWSWVIRKKYNFILFCKLVYKIE